MAAGIIRVGAGEDDGQDVEALTVGMVEQHIRDDRMVILVVIPASTDFQVGPGRACLVDPYT